MRTFAIAVLVGASVTIAVLAAENAISNWFWRSILG